MTGAVMQVKPLYEQLKAEFQKSPRNAAECLRLMSKMKIALLQLNFFPDVTPSKAELIMARDFLEISCQVCIESDDIEGFEKYFTQLKTYYFDFRNELPESAWMGELVGCRLLSLLAQGRLADFHCALETLPADTLRNNVYIKHPVQIEQYMMEGSYNKIFLSRSNLPSERYRVFIDILSETVRGQIAECMETSFAGVSLAQATRILFLDNHAQTARIAAQRNWQITPAADGSGDGYVLFGAAASKSQQKRSAAHSIDAEKVIADFTKYAVDLETIL